MIKEQYDSDVLELEEVAGKLIVFNDDVNSFQHVIQALIDICKHSVVQAEQCTYLIHYKGKCQVKSGDRDELRIMKEGLTDRMITAVVE